MTKHGVAYRHDQWQAFIGQSTTTFGIGFFLSCFLQNAFSASRRRPRQLARIAFAPHLFWYLPDAGSALHRSLPNQACFEKANFGGKARPLQKSSSGLKNVLILHQCLEKGTKVFTKVPQLVWTRPLETFPRSCPRHVWKKKRCRTKPKAVWKVAVSWPYFMSSRFSSTP